MGSKYKSITFANKLMVVARSYILLAK